eukprot:3338756-Amphidinium_carterae.1
MPEVQELCHEEGIYEVDGPVYTWQLEGSSSFTPRRVKWITSGSEIAKVLKTSSEVQRTVHLTSGKTAGAVQYPVSLIGT